MAEKISSQISSHDDIIEQIQEPNSISIDCGLLNRGIDNYHVDVHLSDYFVLACTEVIKGVVSRVVSGSSRATTSSTEGLDSFRAAYEDMIKTTLHRAKTNLKPESIQFLQFGIVKFVLKEVRRQLEDVLHQLEETLAQQQYAGSRNLLPTQEKFAWLRKHYNWFLFKSNRAMFQLLQREENGLRELRKQLLGNDFPEVMNVMFNPMLASASPSDVNMLVECYGLWPKGGVAFTDANLILEEMLGKIVPEREVVPLKSGRPDSGQPEVYDTLHGFFSSRDILGPAENQNELVHEEFCWLEYPGNIRLLFDSSIHEKYLRQVKEHAGMKAQWSMKSDVKKLQKSALDMRKKMFSDTELKEAITAYVLKGNWSTADQDVMDLNVACAYVAGNDSKKILARIDQSKEGAPELIKRLDNLVSEVNKEFKEEVDEKFLRLLTDICRYRLHVKYFRFAHRILNRLKVISEPQEIQLAKAGGNLYELLGFEEHKEQELSDPKIIHHVIVKADVRGSTTVTEELIKRDLNPASYFSLRFFNPINELLAKYGASKVFIEGDAIILGIYEESHEPHQWYAVARACGIAKDILDIVYSKNSHSKQTGLPTLEIGIGICYSDEKPLFLFDEDKPIMISSAIGDADRLSSCSWRLRETFKRGAFNVEVLEIAEGKMQKGEKGQDFIRYNVNGVLLDNIGFKKLMSEIPLKKLKVKTGNGTEVMYVGKFPDVREKERELVIREGKVGYWDGEAILKTDVETDHVFYEVIPNSKLASQVLELARKQ